MDPANRADGMNANKLKRNKANLRVSNHLNISRRSFLATVTAAIAMAPRLSIAKSPDGIIHLRAEKTPHQLTGSTNPSSPLWLYNRSTPGPEIRVKKGETVRVHFTNQLDEPSTIHWHGIRIDNAMDGVPGLTQNAVRSGETFEYVFKAPDAGTFWYHAHTSSMEQVARGLYGPLIVEEHGIGAGAPKDLVLMLDDWWLDEDGNFQDGFDDYLVGKQGGRIGNVFTVNGRPLGQDILVKASETYRLRLVNAANARVFSLHLKASDSRLIALDGINLDRPQPLDDELILAPAQRADFLIDALPGQPIELIDGDGTLAFANDRSEPVRLARFLPEGPPFSETRIYPSPPAPDLPLPDLNSARRFRLLMEGGSLPALEAAAYNGQMMNQSQLAAVQQVWSFNGTANLPVDPFFRVRSGESVVVEIENKTGWQHAMHLHGHHFKTGLDDDSIEQSPWRDTVLMDRHEKLNLAFVANNPGKWLLHCHMLQHAKAGMNTWFEIL